MSSLEEEIGALEGMPTHEGGEDFDPFEMIFGGGRRRGKRGGPRRGNDLQIAFEIDLVEAYFGVQKELTIPRQEHCKECGGSGMILTHDPVASKRPPSQKVTTKKPDADSPSDGEDKPRKRSRGGKGRSGSGKSDAGEPAERGEPATEKEPVAAEA